MTFRAMQALGSCCAYVTILPLTAYATIKQIQL